jgi:hypothetical protein
MPERFSISLGGIPIALVPDQVLGEFEFINHAVEFRTSAAPEVTLQVHCGWFPDLSDAPVSFETNHTWQLLHTAGKWAIKMHSPDQNLYQLGVFPPDFRSGDIYVGSFENAPDRYIFPLYSPLGELYLMNLLGTGLGMLFHAAGVIYQGRGYLFAGHGEAGKSTTARLWDEQPEARVVNDDKVIVRKEAGGFRLYGSP